MAELTDNAALAPKTLPPFMVAVVSMGVSGKADALEKYRQQVLGVMVTAKEAGYRLVHEYNVGNIITFIFEKFRSPEEVSALAERIARETDFTDEDRELAEEIGLDLGGGVELDEGGNPL